MTTPDEEQYDEAVRIGLVMNGGVSLAVWMSGVTHEINRLLGRDTEASPAWRAIVRAPLEHAPEGTERSRRVIVDYVAGTSAGGLNGSLLAAAIARGAPLPGLFDLWRGSARLRTEALLLERGKQGPSLLDGDFFEDEVRGQLGKMQDGTATGPSDMTLLVTATAMSESPWRVEDAQQRPLKVSDHRRVYCFRSGSHGAEGANDFAARDVLARASRASAGFPAAFAPVEETPELRERRWPRPGPEPTEVQWLIDGGVLDNAPFEPLLDEITSDARPDVGQRWIVYVLPSAIGAGAGAGAPGARRTTEGAGPHPPGWQTVVGKLWGLKSEVDLRSDVDALKRLQEETRAAHHRPEELITREPMLTVDAIGAGAASPEPTLFSLYCRTRAKGFIQFVGELGFEGVRLRQGRIAAAEVDKLLDADPYFVPATLEPYDNEGQWQWGGIVAARTVRWMSRDLRTKSGATPSDVRDIGDSDLRIQRLETLLQAAYADLPAGTSAGEALVERAQVVAALVQQFKDPLDEAVGIWSAARSITVADAWRRLLTVEVLQNFAEWHRRPNPWPFDVLLVDTGSRDIGELVLDSDEQLAEDIGANPDLKLYGTRLGHFAAFGAATYRAHDFTWGRLDGALCLATQLLVDVEETERNRLRRVLVDEILCEAFSSKEGDPCKPEDARTTLAANTRRAFDLDDKALLIDILRQDEVDVAEVIESVEQALATLTAETALGDIADEAADAVSDVLKGAVTVMQAVDKLRRRAASFAERCGTVIGRIWPGGD
jgi:patatin-related protein